MCHSKFAIAKEENLMNKKRFERTILCQFLDPNWLSKNYFE